jgi:protein-disulfide isomerase
MSRLVGPALVVCIVISAATQVAILRQVGDLAPVGTAGGPPEGTAEGSRPRHEATEAFEAIVDLDKKRSRGSPNARVAILEFGDYRCGFCGRFQQDVWPELEKQYVMTGRVLFGYRHLPLSGLAGPSAGAARAAECAGEQGRFWEMHDLLFTRTLDLDHVGLETRGEAAGIQAPPFRQCFEADRQTKVIEQDVALARALEIGSTPTFVVGTLSGDRVKVVQRINGAASLAVFQSVVERVETAK